jgi:hypothetical protein
MKIAIQGHLTRGKEVIQILESLGGKNTTKLEGCCRSFYYIDDKNIISDDYKENFPSNYKLYTLEEFEKEFPFKIGDKVIFPVKIGWASGKVTGLTYVGDQLKYEVDNRIAGYRYIEPHKLSLYPMKEERNITLTLEKAKEWYKKGGELREIALQAFSEKELNPLPRSWEEFYKQGNPIASWRYAIPTKYEALFKLEQLRNCWWNGLKPNWLESNVQKYVIRKWRDKFSIETSYVTHSFLSFPTYEMAKEFLECFRDLIEKAGDLI